MSASAATLAVAFLSLTGTNQYHYAAIPTNMAASVVGDGMGAEVPAGDNALRFEDKAFLAEAFAERYRAFGAQSWGYLSEVSPRTEVLFGWSEVADARAKCFANAASQPLSSLSGTAPWAVKSPFFLDPALSPIQSAAVASRVKSALGGLSGTLPYGVAWGDILGTDAPFAVPATNSSPATAFASGQPLKASEVAALYADLAKLTRIGLYDTALRDNDLPTTPSSATALYLKRHTAETVIDGGETSSTDTYAENQSYGFAALRIIAYASKSKTQHFTANDDGEIIGPSGGPTSSASAKWTQSAYYADGGSTPFVNFYPALQPLVKGLPSDSLTARKATSAKAFALVSVALTTKERPGATGSTTSRFYFVMPLSGVSVMSPFAPALLDASGMAGEDFAKGLLSTARSLFPELPTANGAAELLSTVDEPDAPSAAAPYDDMTSGSLTRQNGKSKEIDIGIVAQGVFVIYDMEFNARVKDGGE